MRPLRGPTLVHCLRREKVSPKATTPCIRRVCCHVNKGPCFTLTFGGSSKNCRLHGPRFGNDASGSVARVERGKRPESAYFIFRNFVSCLSFLALQVGGCPAVPNLSERSCIVLGSATGIPGTVSMLFPCGHVRYVLSGSRTKFQTARTVTLRCSCHIHSFSSGCENCSSLGSCLYNEGRRRGGDADRTRRVGRRAKRHTAPGRGENENV